MYQFAYIDSYPTSLMFEISTFMAEFCIYNKILLNMVISDIKIVHNFTQEWDFEARFCLIVMETLCDLPHSIWRPPHQVLKL